ncbi:MAG: class II aldolase/adducin family protein [Alphaproteobacteria bacterium]|nr:class II aldolase/adducin family protein [Alphaproteobacteria bacterium]
MGFATVSPSRDARRKQVDTIETRLAARPSHISPEEWQVRVDLAACYRLIAHFGWDDLVLTHNSARVPGTTDQILINPMGLMFDEITASNLLKVDLDGNLIEPSEYEPIYAGIVIHGAIYQARADVECVIHTHTEADIAVGALEAGLLPLSQWAMRFYNRLGYHDYEGVSLDMDERERLQHSIGNHPVLVLRNHGLLATGHNVAEAFSSTYHFERSAEAQLKIQAAAASGQKIVVPDPDTCERQAAQFSGGNLSRLPGQREWPALLRLCDRLDPSYRT